MPVYVGAMFDYHWNDHAGQIAKIRKANGLPDAATLIVHGSVPGRDLCSRGAMRQDFVRRQDS